MIFVIVNLNKEIIKRKRILFSFLKKQALNKVSTSSKSSYLQHKGEESRLTEYLKFTLHI